MAESDRLPEHRLGTGRIRRFASAGLALALLSPLFCIAILRVPGSLRLELGPNDQPYAHGVSRKWTFDGEGRYRELERRSRFVLPATVRGPGTLSVWVRGSGGRLRASFDDGTVHELSVPSSEESIRVAFDLPPQRVRTHVRLRFEDGSTGRAEVTALSWDSAALLPRGELLFAGASLVLGPLLAALLAGGSLGLALVASLGMAATLVVVSAGSPFTALHWTLQSPGVSILGVVVMALLARFGPRLSPSFWILFFFAFWARAALLFHPSFFFSDLEMHEVLVELAYHRGFVDFFTRWPDYAGSFGLGLSPVEGIRKPFPYPVLFHGLTHLPNSLFHAPVFWLKLNGALFSALGVVPVGYLARRWSGGRPGAELFAGALYLLVPTLSQNLLLLKFDAATGHFFDLTAVAYLAHVSLRIEGFSRWLGTALLVAMSLAAYTSGFVHMGLLVGGSLLLAPILGGLTRRHALGLATAALAGLAIALVSYQPGRLLEFAVSQFGEAELASAEDTTAPESSVDSAILKAASSLGFPVLILGILGTAPGVAKLESPQRLLAVSWLASALVAHALRYAFPELLLHQKEAYWAAGALAVMGGLLLARLWSSERRWPAAAAILALAIAGGEWVGWFSALHRYFFTTYLFR